MKSKFSQFSVRQKTDQNELWKNAVFVFDASVLLNLYRYSVETRAEMIKVLESLDNQIWIPYQAALEFQRNRLNVIADQTKIHSDYSSKLMKEKTDFINGVRKIDNEIRSRNRYFAISTDAFANSVEEIFSNFIRDFESAGTGHKQVNEYDELLEKIESLFDGKMGDPPQDQKFIDELFKEADIRYKFKIPPGYEDAGKDKFGPDEFVHLGLIYKRKYGDYLVWTQILSHAKSNNIDSLIFVTDDNKEDWWLKLTSSGSKTIGPRPELIEESKMKGSIKNFLMYTPKRFLEFAEKQPKNHISERTLEEVSDVSKSLSPPSSNHFDIFNQEGSDRIYSTVQAWLKPEFSSIVFDESSNGFLCSESGLNYLFPIYIVDNGPIFANDIGSAVVVAELNGAYKTCVQITLIFIVRNGTHAGDLRKALSSLEGFVVSDNLNIIIASLVSSSAGRSQMRIFEQVRFNNLNLYSKTHPSS